MATHVEERSGPVGMAREQSERTGTPSKEARTHKTPGAHGGFFNKTGRFLKTLFSDAMNDSITDVGAMMAYYAVLAIFPMVIFIITIAMLVLDHDTVQQGVSMATAAMPQATADLVSAKVTELMNAAGAGFAIGGAALALWGA